MNKEVYRKGKKELLEHKTFKEYEYAIVTLGSYPCAYVRVPKTHKFYGKDVFEEEENIEVHGGLTFSGERKSFNLDGFWIGWDYAHWGDYNLSFIEYEMANPDAHKFTLDEIRKDCLDVINQLIEVKDETIR